MGYVGFFNILELHNKHPFDVFIETGLGRGTSLNYARQFSFKKLISTEILKDEAAKYREMFAPDPRVSILTGNSYELLEELLANNYQDTNICFWLDAHYPGGDLGINAYDYEQDIDIRLPLEKELEVIGKYRKNNNDVILIDDLRIYEHGPYESKNLDEVGLGHIAKYNANFLSKYTEKYDIEKFYQDTGFIKLTPKL